jgi:small ligand-binding sensory domain FIST
MKAKKVTENRAVFTVEEAVNFAIEAAQEAYEEVKKEKHQTEYAAAQAAREAYRNCMPLLETKAAVKAFIACVAQGVHLEFISNEEAKLLLYGAQVWLQIEGVKEAA